jgi:hypothetical protein
VTAGGGAKELPRLLQTSNLPYKRDAPLLLPAGAHTPPDLKKTQPHPPACLTQLNPSLDMSCAALIATGVASQRARQRHMEVFQAVWCCGIRPFQVRA